MTINTEFTREFSERLRAAGVVGAGGAGFPAHLKARSRAELVLANAAECEPLLKKDRALLERSPEEVFTGLELMMRSTGAARGVIGIKNKHGELVERLEGLARTRKNISVARLGDYYPAGDEHCLVYDVTGRVVPMGGLPLDSGCVVCNVETLYNAALCDRRPVTEKYLTIAGAVGRPCTIKVPVGVTYAEAVEIAGGLKVRDAAGIDGGPMMGRVITDFSALVGRTSAGLLVLPKTHPLIVKKARGPRETARIGRSACDQCSFCTELCPRYLLGHTLQPHRAMRSLMFAGAGGKPHSEYAALCCECSLCSLYSCPENLDPKEICAASKSGLREMKAGFKDAVPGRAASAHPVREERKVPVSRLVRRLGLEAYDTGAPYLEHDYKPARVRIPLGGRIGVPCSPKAEVGGLVKKGAVVGEAPAGGPGTPVHASIDGRISTVNEKYVEITAL
ncbi:MAG: 4Fe-4S dicluster domain-containing protein [Elusimicrobiales bacterium]|jgi:Na+-translocating ferredoxin:NAD+ oxidoreductase RnfC subunit